MSLPSFTTMADVLASEGVINYDANAYVIGKKPRYIGKPATYANSGYGYPTSGIPTGVYSNPYTNISCTMTTSGDSFLKGKNEYNKHSLKGQINSETAKKLGVGAVILASICAIVAKTNKNGTIASLLSKVNGSKIVQSVKGSKTVQTAATTVKKIKIPAKFKFLGAAALTAFAAFKFATHEKNNQVIMGSTKSVPQL